MISVLVVTLAFAPAASAESGAMRVPLVELFTSEGCSSCPPADALLSRLGEDGAARLRLVPLAYHVTYWDYIGWHDRFASKRFDERQRAYARSTSAQSLYTPQVLLDGADTGSRDLERLLAERVGAKAAVQIRIEASFDAGKRELTARARGRRLSGAPAGGEPWELQLAVFERRLETPVRAGENRGRTLAHDFVVRELPGAVAWDPSADTAEALVRLSVPASWKADDLGVAAFVRAAGSLRVEQAMVVLLEPRRDVTH